MLRVRGLSEIPDVNKMSWAVRTALGHILHYEMSPI